MSKEEGKASAKGQKRKLADAGLHAPAAGEDAVSDAALVEASSAEESVRQHSGVSAGERRVRLCVASGA